MHSRRNGSWDLPPLSGMRCQSSSRSGGVWLEPRRTVKPALTSALCSVTRITPCGSRSVRAVRSTWSTFNPPAQLLVGTGPGKPQCCRRCASRHRSSTSKSVTGTQSLSRSTMCKPGKTRQRAAKTNVPAHVWWTMWRPLVWPTHHRVPETGPGCEHGWTTRLPLQANAVRRDQDYPNSWDCDYPQGHTR